MARSKITGKPLCTKCQARPLREKTLAALARPPAPPRPPGQCRICLAAETFTPVGHPMNGVYQSSLKNGVCRDRAACEQRQPPLIPEEEL